MATELEKRSAEYMAFCLMDIARKSLQAAMDSKLAMDACGYENSGGVSNSDVLSAAADRAHALAIEELKRCGLSTGERLEIAVDRED